MTEPAENPVSNPINVPDFSLENILGDNHDAVECPAGTNGVFRREETPEHTIVEGFCIECEGKLCVDFITEFSTPLSPIRPACASRMRNLLRCILRSLLCSTTQKRVKEASCRQAVGWPEGKETEGK